MTDEELEIEEVNPGISEKELEEIRRSALVKAQTASHAWIQRGWNIICTSCEYTHACSIPTTKQLVGVKDGKPILTDIIRT